MSTRTNAILTEVQFGLESTYKTKAAATKKIDFIEATIQETPKEGRRDDVINGRLQGQKPLLMLEDATLKIKKRINLEGDGLLWKALMGTVTGPTQQGTPGIYDVSFTKIQSKDLPSLSFEVKDQDDNVYFLVGCIAKSAKISKLQKGDYSEVEFEFVISQILNGIAYLQQDFTTAGAGLTIYTSDRDTEDEFEVGDNITITDGTNTLTEAITGVSGNSISFTTSDTDHTFSAKKTVIYKTLEMTSGLSASSAPISNPADLLFKVKEPGDTSYNEYDSFLDGDIEFTNKIASKHTSNRSKYITIKPIQAGFESKGNIKVNYNSTTDTWLDKTKQKDSNDEPYTWDIMLDLDTLLPAGDGTDNYSFSIIMPEVILRPERPSIVRDEMTEMSVPFEVLDPVTSEPITIAFTNEESAI